jgi:hypothetical protein
MDNRYEQITYCDEDTQILTSTPLSSEELEHIYQLKMKSKGKAYENIVEDLYKFYKNDYSTSDLAEMYNVSIRHIQRIFKFLGINRDKVEAQQIAVTKRNYSKFKESYKKTVLERLTDTQLSGSLLEQYIRHELDLLLSETLANCEVIVGINSMHHIDGEFDVPIIIINKSFLYKYIIEINDGATIKVTSNKDKNRKSKAFYRGYTLFTLETKSYFDSQETPKVRYEKAIKNKLITIVDIIISEVLDNTSSLKLE